MSKKNVEFGKYFCGNKISDYGLENGRVDYRTLAESFDCVLANNLHENLVMTGTDIDYENGYEEYREDTDGTRLSPDEADELIDKLKEKFDELDPYDDNEKYRKEYEELARQLQSRYR